MTFFVDDMQNYDEKTCRNSSKCFHTQSEQYNMTMTFCKCQHTSGERLMWEVCASCKQRLMAITPYGDEGCVSRLRKKYKILHVFHSCVAITTMKELQWKKAQVTMQTKFLHFSNIIFASCPEVLFESWQEPNKCFRWPNGCNELLCKYPVIHA